MNEDFIGYLKNRHFDKTLKKHEKNYRDKKIVIYGTGTMFEALTKKYDLSNLNIIAVADRKFCTTKPDTYLGFNTCTPDEIKDLKPDVVLVAVLRTVSVIEDLRYNILFNTDIKVYPLVDRHIWEILREIWC